MSVSIKFTDQAESRLAEIVNHGHQIQGQFGLDESNRYFASLGLSLARLISMGGIVTADGEQSLIAFTSGLTVGMVFHPEPVETTLSRHLDYIAHISDDEIEALFPHRSGEWSLHS